MLKMSELSHEEKFILEKLKEKEGKLNYKDLQSFIDDTLGLLHKCFH